MSVSGLQCGVERPRQSLVIPTSPHKKGHGAKRPDIKYPRRDGTPEKELLEKSAGSFLVGHTCEKTAPTHRKRT